MTPAAVQMCACTLMAVTLCDSSLECAIGASGKHCGTLVETLFNRPYAPVALAVLMHAQAATGCPAGPKTQEKHLEAKGSAQCCSRAKHHLHCRHDGLQVLGAGAPVPVRGCATAAAVVAAACLVSG